MSIRKQAASVVPRPAKAFLRSFYDAGLSLVDALAFPFWLHRETRRSGRKAVLIWRTAAIGDIVCTLPLLRALREKHPGPMLVYITQIDFKPIVEMSEAADAVYGIRFRYGDRAWIHLIKFLCPGLIAAIYEPRTTDERSKTNGVKAHLIDDLAESCGIVLAERQPRLHPSRELIERTLHRLEMKSKDQLLIGINGGHSWPVKEWSGSKWQLLVNRLHDEFDVSIVQFGLNLPPDVPDDLRALEGVQPLMNKLRGDELVAMIAACDLIVSIDSGPIHLAGAVGVPVVGLFGANEGRFRLPPASPGIGVVHVVPCLYCQHETPRGHWQTGCPHNIRCMRGLEVEPVLQAVREMLAAREGEREPTR
jgi:ADP-heptose:LPS heptosyltransferase